MVVANAEYLTPTGHLHFVAFDKPVRMDSQSSSNEKQ